MGGRMGTEAIGLLPEPKRTPVGYRLYDDADRERLRFIIKAKAIDLTLEEIGEILELRREGQPPCAHVVELLDGKLAAVDQQMRALADFREALVGLREGAGEAQRAEGCVCGIIEQYRPAHPDTPASRLTARLIRREGRRR